MEVARIREIGDMLVAIYSLNRPNSRITNIALAGIKSIELISRFPHLLKTRRFSTCVRQFAQFVLMLSLLVLNMTNRRPHLPVPKVVHNLAMFVFPMVQAYFDISRAIRHFNQENFGTGLTGLFTVWFRVSQAGSALARLSSEVESYDLRENYDYSEQTVEGDTDYKICYLNCNFYKTHMVNLCFSNVLFEESSFRDCRAERTQFLCCTFVACDFNKAVFKGIMKDVFFKNCTLVNADFSGLSIENLTMQDCQINNTRGLDKISIKRKWFT